MKPPLPVGHGQRLCLRGGVVAVPHPDSVLWARPHRAWGRAFRCLFGVGGSDGGRAGAAGARSAHTAGAGAFGPRPGGGFAGHGPAKRRRPGVAWSTFLRPRATAVWPAEAHWHRGGGARGVGAGGRRRLAGRGGPPGRHTKERARGLWPRARSFRALCALPPPPPETPGFSASPEKAFVLPLQLLANKTSGPLPMSGPPAHFAGNPEKFISWFSPLFFKSGGGGVGVE